AVDVANNELVVANFDSVTVHGRTATGNAAPLRMLAGYSTFVNGGNGIAVDAFNHEIVVANFNDNSITVYGRTANGDSTPARAILGAATGLNGPSFLAVTPGTTEIFSGDFNGDGRADILWRHASGAVAIWLLDGTAVIGSAILGVIGADWSIVGVADFNGDGRADILWPASPGWRRGW